MRTIGRSLLVGILVLGFGSGVGWAYKAKVGTRLMYREKGFVPAIRKVVEDGKTHKLRFGKDSPLYEDILVISKDAASDMLRRAKLKDPLKNQFNKRVAFGVEGNQLVPFDAMTGKPLGPPTSKVSILAWLVPYSTGGVWEEDVGYAVELGALVDSHSGAPHLIHLDSGKTITDAEIARHILPPMTVQEATAKNGEWTVSQVNPPQALLEQYQKNLGSPMWFGSKRIGSAKAKLLNSERLDRAKGKLLEKLKQ